MRSWIAVFYIPFTCVWVGMSMYGIYGKQIVSGSFDLAESLSGLPFRIGSICLVSFCMLMVAGKCSITRSGDQFSVFTGVGWLGWTRSYSWSDFSSIREDSLMSRRSCYWKSTGKSIVMEGKRRITFGSMWNDNRRYFVLCALREMMRTSNRQTISSIATPLFR